MRTLVNEIFIISLKNVYKLSKKRTSLLLEKLKQFNFNLNNIHYVGIDGASLKNKTINSKYISNEIYDFNKNIGTLGCALSHLIVLKLIQLKKINDHVLILEEDAMINKNFDFLYKYLPLDYDIIYLHSYDKNLFYKQTEYSNNFLFRKINKPLDNKKNIPGGLQALLINGKNINKILETILPIKEAMDWHYLNFFDKLNFYYTNHKLNLILNDPNFSSIRRAIDLKFNEDTI